MEKPIEGWGMASVLWSRATLADSRRQRRPMFYERRPMFYVLGLLASLVCFGQVALAQQVEATLSDSKVAPGESVEFKITIVGGPASRVPSPPDVPNIRTQYVGQQTSFTSINFNFTRSVTYNYLLTPIKSGLYTIPAINVEVSNTILRTRPLHLLVERNQTGDSDSQGEDVFVEVELEPRTVYVGETVAQTVRVFTAVRLADSTQVSRRPPAGVIEEPLDERTAQLQQREFINGRPYSVEEVRWIFYPVTSGELLVPEIEVQVPVAAERSRRRGRRGRDPFLNDFFNVRRSVPKVFRTEEQRLQVKSVPSVKRPQDFSGLVGHFTIDSDISARSVSLGDSITLTVSIEGEGNIRSLALPPQPVPGFKIYDDAPTLEVTMDSDRTLISQKVFKRALVPQKTGTFTIPPITLSYFDPAQRQFKTLSTRPQLVTVTPGTGQEAAISSTRPGPATKQEIRVMAEDILPIHVGAQVLRNRYVPFTNPATLGLLALPATLFLLADGMRRIRERRLGNPTQLRRRHALKQAHKALKVLEEDASANERARLDGLSRVFRQYLGDKLNIEGGTLMAQEAQVQLINQDIAESLAGQTARFIERIEQARYAPVGFDGSFDDLLTQARTLMNHLEKALRT